MTEHRESGAALSSSPALAPPQTSDISPAEFPNLGVLAIERGLATPAQVQECLRVQQLPGIPRRLGEIMVQRGVLRPDQVIALLGEQRTEIRYCPRCDIQVNVALREDASLYRCSRCRGPLVSPQPGQKLDVVDDSIIVVSRDPLPPEVERAMGERANHFGKYILVRQIGSGGVGEIYQAWDTFLSQFVALKRIRPSRAADTEETKATRVRSLIQEARSAIRLRHPGIVSVFDVGRVQREYYVSMEYLDGETLCSQIAASRSRGFLSPFHENRAAALGLLRAVAEAVHYAHTRPSPIIHCDLKPANVIVDPEGFPHILDFGLARNLRIEYGDDGIVSGTPHYMAPEQASGETAKIGPRTDVYALGAMLYELLAGRPPFVGDALTVLGATIRTRPPGPVEQAAASCAAVGQALRAGPVSPPLEALCMSCLEKDPALRPASVRDFALRLEGEERA